MTLIDKYFFSNGNLSSRYIFLWQLVLYFRKEEPSVNIALKTISDDCPKRNKSNNKKKQKFWFNLVAK